MGTENVTRGIVVFRRVSGVFDDRVLNLMIALASQSKVAIENAGLFREIEDKSRQLEIANRHKSEFLANMSHELRTPLNAIIGFSEVLDQRLFGELNPKQAEYVKDINASGQHLLSLINDILDLSKIEAGRMELQVSEFNLPIALENALTLVHERANRRGVRLELELSNGVGNVTADERKVKQILLNLLSNAIKFTADGGTISVSAKRNREAVEISVADTGIGIATEDQEIIFEEFRQLSPERGQKREGTGLGLALARKFVEMHGGRIWVESALGTGATFTFTLPNRTWPTN
jgi:signal transduction histidine kinase